MSEYDFEGRNKNKNDEEKKKGDGKGKKSGGEAAATKKGDADSVGHEMS